MLHGATHAGGRRSCDAAKGDRARQAGRLNSALRSRANARHVRAVGCLPTMSRFNALDATHHMLCISETHSTSHAPKCTKTHHFFDFFQLPSNAGSRGRTVFAPFAIYASLACLSSSNARAQRFPHSHLALYRLPDKNQTKKLGDYSPNGSIFSRLESLRVKSGRNVSKPIRLLLQVKYTVDD